ncbi:MAG TPA: serine hydrolase [Lapillicoccus sp.]|nr:serine hydrolase [Lapillicoccus sp.]
MTETTTTTGRLLRARPSDVGVPARAIHAVLDDLDRRGLELHSLMVVRHGHVVAEGWWSPYSADRVHLLYSLSKSFTSTAVGFAVAEGRFRLDDRLVDLLPARVPDDIDPALARLTVHHLLSMSTGHREDTLERAWTLDPDDLVRGFLRISPEEPVGSRHAYNNPTTYALAALVEEHTGMFLLDYLRPRLLDPLGIGAAHWDTDERGGALGFTGLHLQTESVARFGQLLLQNGEWLGQQVLPEGWVALATRKHIDSDNDPTRPIDWRQGYGYQYWIARHGYRGDGAHGQFCVVVPEADLVVATTARVDEMQQVLDVLWEQLLPALDGAADAADEAGLTERLAALELPFLTPTHDGPGEAVRFVVDGEGPEEPLARGTEVAVVPDGDGTLLTIGLPRTELALPCGRDHWAEGLAGAGSGTGRGARGAAPADPVPIVGRGGWTGPDTFEADLLLIETPHRIRLRGNGSRLEARWNVPPLSGAALEAHLPR